MKKQELYNKVIAYFQEAMPVAETELHYNNPFELLIAVILSAQCTDKRVNMITPPLYRDFPTPEALAASTPEVIYEYIRSVSYPNNKAKHLVGMAQMLVKDFHGEVPDTLEQLVKLPGVGRKTAMRLVLHLLRQDTAVVEAFGNAIVTLKHEVKYCKVCHNISDTETCRICSSPQRDASVVCVVENIRDVMAVEATQQFRGLYHVLGGVISPMDGIGPGDLQIESLVQRVAAGGINEVILALSTTMEGDTTNFYIYRKLEKLGVKLSVIARGISIGDELEYTDEVTLGRSIVNRTPFSGTA